MAITVTPHPERVRVRFNGRTVADTTHALALREGGYPTVLYIPRADAEMNSATARSVHASLPRRWALKVKKWAMLGGLGLVRVFLWEAALGVYGEHWLLLGLTVGLSLLGVVVFGTLAGSLLPFMFRRLGVDPATASAPFVATLVDVSGVVIYFGAASLLLRGTLL